MNDAQNDIDALRNDLIMRGEFGWHAALTALVADRDALVAERDALKTAIDNCLKSQQGNDTRFDRTLRSYMAENDALRQRVEKQNSELKSMAISNANLSPALLSLRGRLEEADAAIAAMRKQGGGA